MGPAVLLAIDTSTRTGSVALFESGSLRAHRVLEPKVNTTTMLAPAVRELVPDLSAIEVYAVTIGPGSFTGLRIALAFLKGVAFVHPRPVVPVSSLAVLARGMFDADADAALALPMLDARRNEVYGALYTRALQIDPALEEASHPIASIASRVRGKERVLAGGDGVLLAHGEDPPWRAAPRELWIPDARVLGKIATELFSRGVGVTAAELEPKYLQLAPAEVP
jgi:tRNA threonylcarbamoyladenosine biosynthesis protein TsaB